MEHYEPYRGEHGVHQVRLTFQHENTKAYINSSMGGNVHGASIINSFTDLENGISAPVNDVENQKHCVFYQDDLDENRKYAEVECIKFVDDAGNELIIDLPDAADHLVAVEIVGFTPEKD